MNNNLFLGDVEVFLVEPKAHIRGFLKDSLVRYRFRRIREFGAVKEVKAGLAELTPDLLVCDVDGLDDPILPVIRSIRNNDLGRNPFLVVVCLAWEPTPELASAITSAGADDLLIKPISAQMLAERVQTLIDFRKKFVVTSDYIGPDRRQKPRPEDRTPLFDVPNTLRLKALGEAKGLDLQSEIDRVMATLNEEKMQRHAFQIAVLLELLAGDPRPRQIQMHLAKLQPVAVDLLRRLKDPTPEVEAACRSLLQMVEKLLGPARPDAEEMRAYGVEILRAFNPAADIEELKQGVNEAVGKIRARQAAEANANSMALITGAAQ